MTKLAEVRSRCGWGQGWCWMHPHVQLVGCKMPQQCWRKPVSTQKISIFGPFSPAYGNERASWRIFTATVVLERSCGKPRGMAMKNEVYGYVEYNLQQ